MNEAAAASKALEDVANNQVIMMELVLYAIISIVLILLMDLWAGKVIGNKQSMEYKVLRIPKYISLFIICGFTVIVGIMCLYNQDFSVTRSTLTYFGVPYFIGLFSPAASPSPFPTPNTPPCGPTPRRISMGRTGTRAERKKPNAEAFGFLQCI